MPTREEMLRTIHRVVGTTSIAMKGYNERQQYVFIGDVMQWIENRKGGRKTRISLKQLFAVRKKKREPIQAQSDLCVSTVFTLIKEQCTPDE